MLRRFIAGFAAVVLVLPAAAHEYALGALVIAHPWSRPTAPGMPMGVAYLSISNHGKAADALTGASTPLAAHVEFHQTTISGGMARMRPLKEVVIGPGATVRIEPGAIHLMLVDLKEPLAPGKAVPLTLEFRLAGRITVMLDVESPDAQPAVAGADAAGHGPSR